MSALTGILASCILLASQTYGVPPSVLIGIRHVEGGKIGQEAGPNDNGSYDLGPMQINTVWLPKLARTWKVDERTARTWIRDDPCTNVGVAAWILRGHLDETGDIVRAIAHYHSRTPVYGTRYKYKVIRQMQRYGMIGNMR